MTTWAPERGCNVRRKRGRWHTSWDPCLLTFHLTHHLTPICWSFLHDFLSRQKLSLKQLSLVLKAKQMLPTMTWPRGTWPLLFEGFAFFLQEVKPKIIIKFTLHCYKTGDHKLSIYHTRSEDLLMIYLTTLVNSIRFTESKADMANTNCALWKESRVQF